MACPHIAGVAAQLLQWDPSLTTSDVLRILTTDCSVEYGELKSSTGRVIRSQSGGAAGDIGPCAGGVNLKGPINGLELYLIAGVALCLFFCCGAFVLYFFCRNCMNRRGG